MRRPARRAPPAAWPLLATLIAAQVLYGRSPPRSPAATRTMLRLMLAVAAGESVAAQGRRRGLAVGACAGAVGFGAELLGVATGRPFGRYAYSRHLGRQTAGVPLLAAAAWAIMARPAWIAAGWITPDPRVRVPVAAWALTGWDVYVDPRMVAEGYWTWERSGRYEGIPATNFAGWFGTALVAFALAARLDRARPQPRDDGALALYAWTWLGETVANLVFWRRPKTAAGGALAMGIVAAPALRARSRSR
jgi:putative membrane protein